MVNENVNFTMSWLKLQLNPYMIREIGFKLATFEQYPAVLCPNATHTVETPLVNVLLLTHPSCGRVTVEDHSLCVRQQAKL